MKKIIILIQFFFLIFLTSCKSQSKEANLTPPPPFKANGIVLYIEPMNDDPIDTNQALYYVTNREEKTFTLKKNQQYIFLLTGCKITEYGFNAEMLINSDHKLIYEPSLLKVTDYAYILNDQNDPWASGLWGIYYVESVSNATEATMGFYAYSYLIKVNLRFE